MYKGMDRAIGFSERECIFLFFAGSPENEQESLDFLKLPQREKTIRLRQKFNWFDKYGDSSRGTEVDKDYEEKKKLCLDRLIPESDFAWIDQLPLSHLLYLITIYMERTEKTAAIELILSLPIENETASNIIKLLIDLEGINKDESHNLNNQFMKKAESIDIEVVRIVDFLDKQKSKNHNIEQWLYDYQLKNFTQHQTLDGFNRNLTITPRDKVIYNALYHNNIELFMLRASRAWSQKKHRESQNGKRNQSYSLTEKTIEKLESLSQIQRRRKNEILEILIEDAWNEINKKPNRS